MPEYSNRPNRPYGGMKKTNSFNSSQNRTRERETSDEKQDGVMIDKQRKYEDYAWTLVYLSEGSPTDPAPFSQREPVIQAVGDIYFTLLELSPRKGANVKPLIKIGIGKDNRTVITRIKRRISYNDLSPSSENILEDCLLLIVTNQEFRFVNWFNKASLVTSRMHSFKLLPGIGDTNLETLLTQRKESVFTSFEDIALRTKISDPKKLIVGRIVKELVNLDEKYRLFTRKP